MKKFTLLVFIVLMTLFSYGQGHFIPAFTGNGLDHMTLNVLTATLSGVDLEAGDEIAVFDGSVCCGIAILTEPLNSSNFVGIYASKSDANPQNGYIAGHAITYKFWDKSANKAISGVSSEYTDGVDILIAPTFTVGESFFVKLSCDNPINLKPVSKAGADQTVGKSSFVTLDGSASSDADTDPLTYLWNVPAGITLSSTNVAKPTFTAPIVATETNYTFSLIVNDGMDNSTLDEVVITVKPSVAPTANAGSNQTVNELALVTLNGTASDPDAGDVLTYKWSGPAAIKFSSTTDLNTTFTAPEVWDFSVDYTLSLVANDGTVDSPVSTVVITVKNVNKAPVANAGPDQSINEGVVVTLDALDLKTPSKDPDFDDITYKWTAPVGITLSSTTVAKPTFTAPEVNADKTYTFSLVVNDKKLDSQADQIVVTVKNINKVPVANAGVDQSVNENVTVTLDGSASSDDEGGTLTYLWTGPTDITLSSTTDAKPTFTAPEVTADTDYTFSLVVNDGTDNSIANVVVIKVKQVNKAPVANAGLAQSVNEGSIVTLDGSASSDPDANGLTYAWTAPAGITTLSLTTDAKPTFTAPEVTADTDYTFSLVVNDGTLSSISSQVIITVKQVNKAPVANAGPNQSPNELTVVTLDGLLSSDPDSDGLTYAWTVPAGSGITLSSTTASKPTFTAPEVATDTPYTFSLIVNDGKLNSIAAGEVVITVKQVNKAPVANAGTAKQATEKKTVELDGSLSSDFDGDALTYQWTVPAGSGITLSNATAKKPTFTAPVVVASTPYTFSLVVNDGALNSPSVDVIITVIPNRAPVANAGPAQTQSQKSLVTLDGSGSTDPDGDELTYRWTIPAGILSFSSTTGAQLTFTAPDVLVNTPYTFSLVVNDGVLFSPSVDVIITVIPNRIPVANAGTAQSANENTLVTLDGSASADGDVGDVLTYKWTAPAGSGITFNDDTAQKPTITTPEIMADTDFPISLVVRDGKDDSPAATVVVTVKQVNKAPVANAGADKEVTEKKLVELDGSLSSDFDNDARTYLWTAPAGIILSDATAQKPTFTAPAFAVSNNYSFSLVVNDGKVNSTANEVVIKVIPNKIPVANAGPDQSVNEGTLLVTLDGSVSSDPDAGDVLTYLWTAPAEITLSSNTIAKPTFTAPEVFATKDFILSLVVNDGALNSIAGQVVITVKQVNKEPVANAGTDKEVTEKKVLQLDGSLSADPDNDVVLTYLWTVPVGITLSSTTVAKPTFTAPVVAANTDYIFSLVVNDGALSSPSVNVVITVIPNIAPVANAGPDQTVYQKQNVSLNGSTSSDPENDVLTYHWTVPAGITLINPDSSNPNFEAPLVTADTDYSIKLIVNDGEFDSPENEIIVRVLQNQIPLANAGVDQTMNEGSSGTLDGSASSDLDGDALTYLWTAPAGITLSSTTAAKPTFTAPEVNANIFLTFTLVVNDGKENSSADQVQVKVNQVNKAPVANAGTNLTVDEGATATLDGSASSDFENDVLTYLWTAPAGITLNSNTAAKPTFTAPEVAVNTEFTFSLVVNDGFLNSIADQVVVTVNQVNKAPLANAGSDQTINEGATATLDGSASSDFDNNALTYSWTAPAGITLNSNTVAKPTFTTPEVAVNTEFTFTLVVNDGLLNSVADQVVITVNQVNKAPLANAGANQTINEGVIATLDGSASSDFENDALTYLWTAPAGIVLNSNTAAKPTFTAPEVAVNTEFTFSLVVNDGFLNSVADQVVVTVNQVNKAPLTNAGSDQTINEGATATLDGSASSDFENDALTYLWTAPAGITLNSNAVAKPTFTAPEVAVNTEFTFSLVVNDGLLNSVADQVVITVNQVNKAPFANAGADQTINEGVITTLDGSASSDFENDALTYLWTAPAGIILSSLTEAKPTFTAPEVSTNSNYSFTLVVSDGTVTSSADQVRVTVKQVNKAPIAKAGIDVSFNEGDMVTINGLASSDPDSDALTYLWTAPTGITLSSNTIAKPTFIAPEVAANTNYTFSLVVNDKIANSTADLVTITIKNVNKAPISNAGTDLSVNELAVVTLDGAASSDPDSDALTYLWTAPTGITLSSNTIAQPTFTTPEVTTNTNYTFSLVVNDGTVNSVADQIVITVANVDHSPYVKNLISDVSVDKGSPDQVIDLKNIFGDNDLGDVLTYSISSNTNDNVVNGKITGSDLTLSFSTVNIGLSEIEITASSNGIEVKSKFKVDVKIPTGIDLLSDDANVQIYPNPTKGDVQLKFNQTPKAGTWISVYDISGKVISKSLAGNKQEYLNLKGNPTGLYFIKIDQKTQKTYKLIIE